MCLRLELEVGLHFLRLFEGKYTGLNNSNTVLGHFIAQNYKKEAPQQYRSSFIGPEIHRPP